MLFRSRIALGKLRDSTWTRYQHTLSGFTELHPHRFRDTFCVGMLVRGIDPYSVARLVGITVDILERHYAPFIPELRERVRRALNSGEGLEAMPGPNTDSRKRKERIQ